MVKEKINKLMNSTTEELNENTNIIDTDNNINIYLKDTIEKEKTPVKTICVTQIVPMSLSSVETENGKYIVLYTFARDQINDESYILATKYVTDNDTVYNMIANNPLHDKNNHISRKLLSNALSHMYPTYVTDLDFYYDETADDKDPDTVYKRFYTFASFNDPNSTAILRINMTPEVFSVLAFIDDYIIYNGNNLHELNKVCIAGYSNLDMTLPKDYIVEDILSVEGIIQESEDDNSNIVVAFKVKLKGDNNTYTILTSFNSDKSYTPDKFKGFTDDMISGYGNNIYNYVSNYMVPMKFSNIDEDFVIIKADNLNRLSKILLIDDKNMKKLETLIEEF